MVDVVFCSQVIEHVGDDVALLRCLARYLAHGGLLILGTTNEGCWLQRVRNSFRTGYSDHVHAYREKEIARKIESAGFTIRKTYREIFYPGSDRLYYWLAGKPWGFALLRALTGIFPSQCSDYYFVCAKV
jgi:2-polyprenyl-3-methyl-5-hydroxy-6-metoxy-1,4-benzoquinol methylase